MPTNNPRPPAGITTEYLADGIRRGMAHQPALVAAARPVANRLSVLIRKRLPGITAADTGAVMVHLAAFLADVMTVLTGQGDGVADAVQTATSAIAMAGTELYDSGETRADTGHAELTEQLLTFLDAFAYDPDDTVIDEVHDRRLTVGMLRAAAAGLAQVPAAYSSGPRCDSHADPGFVGDQTIQCQLPLGHFWHRNGQRTWTP